MKNTENLANITTERIQNQNNSELKDIFTTSKSLNGFLAFLIMIGTVFMSLI